jgi:TolA-binding protein
MQFTLQELEDRLKDAIKRIETLESGIQTQTAQKRADQQAKTDG